MSASISNILDLQKKFNEPVPLPSPTTTASTNRRPIGTAVAIGGLGVDFSQFALDTALMVNFEPVQVATVPIDEDYHGWLLGQAALLRSQRFGSLDWNNLAEELEAMAADNRRRVKKQLKRLLLHLLKYRVQPEAWERHESWRRSILNAREEINDVLEESPGVFQGKEREIFATAYERAREKASEETHLPLKKFPEQSPWTFEQARTDNSIVPRRYILEVPD